MLNSIQRGGRFVAGGEIPLYMTVAEKQQLAQKWRDAYPEKAAAFIEELTRYVSAAPIHAALLGPIAERYGVPKPVSALIRFYSHLRIIPAAESRVGSPALCLADMMEDHTYWSKFRRKNPEGISESIDLNPWYELGIADSGREFDATRVAIFEAFLISKYGAGTLRDLAGVCVAFKRMSGVSFQGFFGGLRPAEFMKHPLAAGRFIWTWSEDDPPCLYCAARKSSFSTYGSGDCCSADPTIVRELLQLASEKLPEDINFWVVARKHKATITAVMVAYLAALRQALLTKSDAKRAVQAMPRLDTELARELYAEAKKGLEIYTSVIEKIEKIFPELVK